MCACVLEMGVSHVCSCYYCHHCSLADREQQKDAEVKHCTAEVSCVTICACVEVYLDFTVGVVWVWLVRLKCYQ